MENVGIFYGHLEHITAIWYILWPFGNLVAIWYIFHRFGILYETKLATLMYIGRTESFCSKTCHTFLVKNAPSLWRHDVMTTWALFHEKGVSTRFVFLRPQKMANLLTTPFLIDIPSVAKWLTKYLYIIKNSKKLTHVMCLKLNA
jgi:hypothetical protein